MLGDADFKKIPTKVRVGVANRAEVAQNTVDRFLKGETFPRSADLEKMVTAVADEAGESDWLDPWKGAVARAEAARGRFEDFLSSESPAPDQIEREAKAAEQAADAASEGSDPAE